MRKLEKPNFKNVVYLNNNQTPDGGNTIMEEYAKKYELEAVKNEILNEVKLISKDISNNTQSIEQKIESSEKLINQKMTSIENKIAWILGIVAAVVGAVFIKIFFNIG
ncbi:hypothetical protein [Enterococcus lactis]|uniref:hypothetical protein n=1 Tax=Enterococcus lactis TaxID=357441 RepID=UPI0012E16C55|nr:hypothetical protein [Enterococcus lactis]EGP4828629.1 hypothetical protein [Enterococcus faecium]EGP5038240.1 hypothetical protein [Enterococcus faecium]EGP5737547.1 hypothetical protein [Enterococcus faecium]EMF0310655.1 hypothetical protein [Enterococcus faecium]EMF0489198.1 hypothetical protein [Enterococcus faecium]